VDRRASRGSPEEKPIAAGIIQIRNLPFPGL